MQRPTREAASGRTAWKNGPTTLVRRRDRDDVDPAAAAIEFDDAVDEREQSVIASLPDVLAGVELGAALANENVAVANLLAAETLDAAPLWVRIATVAAGTLTLF